MKKVQRILASALLVALALTLTACGNDIEGSWMLTGGTALEELLGSDSDMSLSDLGVSIIFNFNDGDEFEMVMSAYGMSESYSGTWKTDGNKVTMTVDGDPLVANYKISGSKLTLTILDDYGSGTLVFTKD